jgi:ubiquinol-cytochrome c reductase cytochrome b subunit
MANRSRASALVAGLRGRAFPDHWSFMLGQIAFHSFIVLTLSGVILLLFYEPSSEQVTYHGPYDALRGIEMSRALESTLAISFEVRGGLLLRQVHHWASLLMVASILMHMLHLFFTGAFRRPRRLSWLTVFLLLIVAMGAGFTGAVLPDDMASGTSLAVLDGVLKATPFVGTWLSTLLFGGPFPGDIIALFYPLHILIIPAALLLIFAAQVILALVHKPAQHAALGRTEDNVVGPALPVFVVKSAGFFVIVSGVVVLMAATVTVNPVWLYGPADPSSASAGATPQWYLAFVDGALRLVPPGWEFVWLGKTWTLAVLIPVVVTTLFLLTVTAYPFVEGWIDGDNKSHHILERPRNNPTRTGFGVAGVVFYGVLWAAAGTNAIALEFQLSADAVIHAFQALLILGPVIGFSITKRICLGLQRKDRDVALHGFETGQILRSPIGEYAETHQPLDIDQRWRLVRREEHLPLTLRPDARGRITPVHRLRARLSRWFFEDQVPPISRTETEGGPPDCEPESRRTQGGPSLGVNAGEKQHRQRGDGDGAPALPRQ